jgi:hypothetical protein
MKFSVEISHSIKGNTERGLQYFAVFLYCSGPFLISCSSNAPPPPHREGAPLPLSWAFYSLYIRCFIVPCPTWEDHAIYSTL